MLPFLDHNWDIASFSGLGVYKTVFRDFTQIFQLPASFIAQKGSLLVIIDIPITPLADLGKFSLYRYHPMPFLHRGQLMKVTSTEHLLAVSKHREQFVPVSGADLHQCLHVGENFLCPFIGVSQTEEYPCCLCAIFLAQMKRVAKECELTFLRQRFHLERLNATLFVSFTNGSLTGVSTCQGRQSQLSFSGLQHFSLEPGCVLNVAGVTFVAAFNPGVSVQQVVSFFPANFSLFDNDSALLSDLSRALSSS